MAPGGQHGAQQRRRLSDCPSMLSVSAGVLCARTRSSKAPERPYCSHAAARGGDSRWSLAARKGTHGDPPSSPRAGPIRVTPVSHGHPAGTMVSDSEEGSGARHPAEVRHDTPATGHAQAPSHGRAAVPAAADGPASHRPSQRPGGRVRLGVFRGPCHECRRQDHRHRAAAAHRGDPRHQQRLRGHLHRPGRRRLPGGPGDPHHRREGGLVPPAARRRNRHRLPHADLPGPAGPHVVPVRGPRGPRGAGGQAGPNGPSGTDYIYNDRYQQIALVRAGNRDATDFHEFLITPQNTAMILADKVTTANLTSIGGPADQRVIDGLVQEIDIRTGRVVFQWDSAVHVPYTDSCVPRPPSPSVPWDWFHINAVHLDTNGNLLVDSRNTWTAFKVNRHSGQIMWQLGGKHSSFTLRAAPGQVLDRDGEIFAWRHDPEAIGGRQYTVFNDESGGDLLGSSRVVTVNSTSPPGWPPWSNRTTTPKVRSRRSWAIDNALFLVAGLRLVLLMLGASCRVR